jgi:N-glycosylase/DNA lyase
MTLVELRKLYVERKNEINRRLREFEEVYRSGDDEKIFKELCFCILTANASAMMGINCIEAVGRMLLTGDEEELRECLHGRHRFWKTRASYIAYTREHLYRGINCRLQKKIGSFPTAESLRDFFANSPLIKGLGYKEASHFLRNIGFRGYAILDKHILNCLWEFRVIEDSARPKNKRTYIEIENRMRKFAHDIGIDFDELDLLLWSTKTGKILK